MEESIAYCLQLERSLAASCYGPSLSLVRNVVGTERCFQLVGLIASGWNAVLLPAGVGRFSQLVRIVTLSWYGALISAGAAHCFQPDGVLLAARAALLPVGADRCSQLLRIVALSWYGSLLPAGTECCA